jgi:hypothetical protein
MDLIDQAMTEAMFHVNKATELLEIVFSELKRIQLAKEIEDMTGESDPELD